ncbi:MAG: N-acetyltransferase [Bacteroidia bacterium]|nr:N-acetyltransferase [Bacteroidia bacterium]
MEILIKITTEKDFFKTEYITRESFWNVYKPGCDEHLILHNIRKSKAYINKLDLIAVFENETIGHIISTKAKVLDSQNNEHEILCVGPLSVLPELQRKGIGSKLMYESIKVAKELGNHGMILFGNPEYYHRFGFKNAQKYCITTKDNQNFEPFMALELHENGLNNIKGKFFEDNTFVTKPDELIEFEKQFPYKEKLVTETQLKH